MSEMTLGPGFMSSEDFIIVGQKMVDDEGVVVLVGKPSDVHMREAVSLKAGASITLTMNLAPGYAKFRARDFQHAMEMIRARQG